MQANLIHGTVRGPLPRTVNCARLSRPTAPRAAHQDDLYKHDVPLSPLMSTKLSLDQTELGGLGFVANAPIHTGERLLVTPPIETVWAELGGQPNLVDLVEAIIPHLSGSCGGSHDDTGSERAWRSDWLRSLFQGTTDSSGSSDAGCSASTSGQGGAHDGTAGHAGSAQSSRFQLVQRLLHHAAPSSRAFPAGSAEPPLMGADRQAEQQQQQERLAQERQWSHGLTSTSTSPPTPEDARAAAERLVDYNAYGTQAQDFAAAHLRGVASRELGGFCGVWPIFSVFNHSCAPNTVFFSICSSTSPDRFISSSSGCSSCSGSGNEAAGSDSNSSRDDSSSSRISQQEPHLIMHAAREIKAGEAVTITYMGPQLLQPLETRRMHLQASYGFECRCPRCTFESQLPSDARAAMHTLSQSAEVAQEAIGDALGPELGGDQELLETAQAALSHVRREFASVCHGLGLVGNSQSALTNTGKSSSSLDCPNGSSEQQVQQLLWLQASYYALHSPTVADRTDLADVEQAIKAWGKEDEAQGPLPADIAVFEGAQRIIQEVAPGSDLHITLSVQTKFCAERLLGALGAISRPRLRAKDQADNDGEEEVVAWLQEGLRRADEAAGLAIRSRYGKVSQEYEERLFWLSATERLPKPLLQLAWAYREQRLSALQNAL